MDEFLTPMDYEFEKAVDFVNGLTLDISFGHIIRTIEDLQDEERLALEVGDIVGAERHQEKIRFFLDLIPVDGARAKA